MEQNKRPNDAIIRVKEALSRSGYVALVNATDLKEVLDYLKRVEYNQCECD